MECLWKLQSLEFDETAGDKTAAIIVELRLQIPAPVLSHYDRMRARGKRGMAAVYNQSFAGCHMRVTKATVIALMHGEDIQICENCGRYLYLQFPKPADIAGTAEKAARKSSKPMELNRMA